MRSTKKLRSSGIIVCVLTLAFLIVAVPRLQYPDLDHGDEWADAELLISGKNFVKFGFIQTRFLPFYEADIDILCVPYTHYPALACVVSGVAQGVGGVTSLRVFRGAALLFSLLAVICWYFAVSIYARSRSAGFLCALFYLTNPYFIYGADGLGQLSYSEALRAGIVLLCLIAPGNGLSRRVVFCPLPVAAQERGCVFFMAGCSFLLQRSGCGFSCTSGAECLVFRRDHRRA
jgi:4-amino-4-deoxy-L-arabinose transferase-like glycosyltransferase